MTPSMFLDRDYNSKDGTEEENIPVEVAWF